MQTEKILLVWYSRTGTTREIASEIQHELACDREELVDRTNREGIIGWLRSGFDAALKRRTTLDAVRHDPRDYDLVIVGTPVWSGQLPPATRTYLGAHRGEFPRVAFFCTSGTGETRRVFEEMARVSGRAPEQILAVRHDESRTTASQQCVREFLDTLRHSSLAA